MLSPLAAPTTPRQEGARCCSCAGRFVAAATVVTVLAPLLEVI